MGCLVSPADLVALSPQDHLGPPGALGSDFQAKVFAGAKELLGNTEAEAGMEAGLQGQLDLPAGKRTNAKAEAGLGLLAIANRAQRNPDADEATVGRELAALGPVLFDGEDGRLLGQLLKGRMLKGRILAGSRQESPLGFGNLPLPTPVVCAPKLPAVGPQGGIGP